MTWALSYEFVVGTSESTNAAYHTAAILKKKQVTSYALQTEKQNKKKKKQLLSFSICVVYMAMKITHKLIHMRYIPRHIEKKEVVSYASITQTHKKEMTCHKVTNLRTEA